jgi:hypothetical protein
VDIKPKTPDLTPELHFAFAWTVDGRLPTPTAKLNHPNCISVDCGPWTSNAGKWNEPRANQGYAI